MNDNYKIFGLDETCSDEELERAYKTLKAKYSEDRFLEGEAGNYAAKKLTELENAYREVTSERREGIHDRTDSTSIFAKIENLIRSGNLQEAQYELDGFNERNAEWHYLQSVVFYKNFTSYTSGDDKRYEEHEEPRQMGGEGCCQWCCEMAICNACLNCFCNSIGC